MSLFSLLLEGMILRRINWANHVFTDMLKRLVIASIHPSKFQNNSRRWCANLLGPTSPAVAQFSGELNDPNRENAWESCPLRSFSFPLVEMPQSHLSPSS